MASSTSSGRMPHVRPDPRLAPTLRLLKGDPALSLHERIRRQRRPSQDDVSTVILAVEPGPLTPIRAGSPQAAQEAYQKARQATFAPKPCSEPPPIQNGQGRAPSDAAPAAQAFYLGFRITTILLVIGALALAYKVLHP